MYVHRVQWETHFWKFVLFFVDVIIFPYIFFNATDFPTKYHVILTNKIKEAIFGYPTTQPADIWHLNWQKPLLFTMNFHIAGTPNPGKGHLTISY